MPHKGRLPAEEKAKIVEEYIHGRMGAKAIQSEYGIGWTTLRDWIRLYKVRGVEGLIPATQWRKYPPAVKLLAVEEYLSGGISQDDICVKYDISDRRVLRKWIEWYNGRGDFKHPNSGGAIYMAKGRKTTLDERIEIVSHCIANNKDYGSTIERYGVSYQQVYGWVMKYEQDGADSLSDRRGKRKKEASMN